MTEICARAILRLIAVVIVMVGLCMASSTLINYIGASRVMGGTLNNAVSQVGTYSLFANLAISGLGFALFACSSKLAALVIE